MVFFTCQGCGESVKKAQVEKHKQQCRRSDLLTCADCSRDFRGQEYQTHLKCISEQQKYGGANFVAKENKGEVKQSKWFEQVQRAIDSTDTQNESLRALLERLKNYPNIPRKESKFKNMLLNSLREKNPRLVAEAWAAISKAENSSDKLTNPGNDKIETNDNIDNKHSKKQQNGEEKAEKTTLGNGLQQNGDESDKKHKLGNKSDKKHKSGDKSDKNHEFGDKKRKLDDKSDKKHELRDESDEKHKLGDKSDKKHKLCNESDKNHQLGDDSDKNHQLGDDSDEISSNSKRPRMDRKTETSEGGVVKIKSIIKKLLRETEKGEMKLTKLKKRVAKALQVTNVDEIEKLYARIDGKLAKFVVDGKVVRLKC